MRLHYTDVPVLLGRGFEFGITDEFLWAVDRDGDSWQAHVDGEFIYMAQRPKGQRSLLSRRTMRHGEFYSLFPGF